MRKKINDVYYNINEDEFKKIDHPDFTSLHILQDLGSLERMVGLLNELSIIVNKVNILGYTHGGFIPLNVDSNIIVFYDNLDLSHQKNLKLNIEEQKKTNIFEGDLDLLDIGGESITFFDASWRSPIKYNDKSIIVTKHTLTNHNYTTYKLWEDYKLYIPNPLLKKFLTEFRYYIEDDTLNFDNLIHFTCIVKNGGDEFKEMLTRNLPFIDKWTILDTGSNDDTIKNITEILKDKKGKLYTEPFVDFSTSRNRCLDLAGKSCKYLVMLDDTYVLEGNFRSFLQTVRGDQFGDSYSIFIKSNDVTYLSNRVIKSHKNLRYIYKVHEVITPENNTTVYIPLNISSVLDLRSDYMEKRTSDRKIKDLKMLFEMMEEDPNDPRNYYYIAQTYNLLNEPQKAYDYYIKRSRMEGFIQERIDAYFEAARILNFTLNGPWEECISLYEKSYELDKNRPEPLYFIGINYYLNNDHKKAYDYFCRAFDLGFSENSQYSLKPTITYYFLPKFLALLCYEFKNYTLGEKCCKRFLHHNKEKNVDHNIMQNLDKIFGVLINAPEPDYKVEDTKYNCLFMKNKNDNLIKTLRSMYENLNIFTEHNIDDDKKDVIKIEIFKHFCRHKMIDNLYIDDLSYYPLCLESKVANIYLVIDEKLEEGTVIPIGDGLKKIICISEDIYEHFRNLFQNLKELTTTINEFFTVKKDIVEKDESREDILNIYDHTELNIYLGNNKKFKKVFIKEMEITDKRYFELDIGWNLLDKEGIIYIDNKTNYELIKYFYNRYRDKFTIVVHGVFKKI